jgi:hypothetical protein
MKVKIFHAYRTTNNGLFCGNEGKFLEAALNEWLKDNPNPKNIISTGDSYVTVILIY